MKYVAILTIPAVLFLAGCAYKAPLTKDHIIPIDSAMLGLWSQVSEKGNTSDPDEQMLVLKFSDTEYLIHFASENEKIFLRGYPIKIGKISCLQLQILGNEAGPPDKNEKDLFLVVSCMLTNDQLVVKMLNENLVDDNLETSEALRKAFLKHQDNKNLFTDPCKFQRVNTGAEKPVASTPRIGTYDSRAIAVAFVGSEVFEQTMADLKLRHDKAQAAGDKELTAKLEAEGIALQKELHKQGFSTAPVENILKHIASQLPEIKKQAQIDMIVSKWNTKALAENPSAEQVDVTMFLVEAFKPNDKQKKSAVEIQKHDPVPLEKMNDHKH